MLLSPEDALQFFKLHSSLMHFVNQRLKVVPQVNSPLKFSSISVDDQAKVVDAFLENRDLIDAFVAENRADLTDEELEIVLSWHQLVAGKFYVFRQLKQHMVFLSMKDPVTAYGVVALTDPFERLVGPRLPVMVDTVLLPLKDRIIYNGLMKGYNISFGPGVRSNLNDDYRAAKAREGIVASLPKALTPMQPNKPDKQKKRKQPTSNELGGIREAVVEMVDSFCREFLNEEYAQLCLKLTDKLARKRTSPLLRGKVNSWASGIVRTIGWVNYLDDPASEPHLDLSEIDQAFGVSKSTGQAKSLEIRKLLKIYPFDLEWTVPGRLGENPLAWMVESGGFLIDMRHMPREIQEAAFAQGLIPYIPGEEPGKAPEKSRNGKAKQTDTGPLYQFKITLLGVKPPIWRRIQVQDCTLHQFHEHIQTAMGWTNSHLHQFEIKKTIYSPPSPMGEFDDDLQGEDSTKVLLSELLPKRNKGFRLRYEYDFGDGWQHEVICEGTHQPEPGQKYPLCLQGKRACPPEDVGGSWGYADYLQALADPRHSEHNELLEWGGKFDPEAFDPVEQTRSMRAGMPSWF